MECRRANVTALEPMTSLVNRPISTTINSGGFIAVAAMNMRQTTQFFTSYLKNLSSWGILTCVPTSP